MEDTDKKWRLKNFLSMHDKDDINGGFNYDKQFGALANLGKHDLSGKKGGDSGD